MKLKRTILGIAAGLVALSGTRVVDRPEQRLDCNQESRQHIKGPRTTDLTLYKLIIERRQLYVRDCMLNAPDIEETSSIPIPLPPKRPAN